MKENYEEIEVLKLNLIFIKVKNVYIIKFKCFKDLNKIKKNLFFFPSLCAKYQNVIF